MGILIKSATILFPNSDRRGPLDILIEDGLIKRIGSDLQIRSNDIRLITGKNLHISVGWFDIGAYMGEPGEEHHETIKTVTRAAIQGGYTAIAPFSSPVKPVQSKSEIEFIRIASSDGPLEIFPVGSLSEDMKGENLAELLDMASYGAVAFSDGLAHCLSSGLLMRGLLYLRKIQGLVIHCPSISDLHGDAQVHESDISASYGLTGFPREAEYVTLERDLAILKYTKSRMMSHLLTSAGSVRQLEAYKREGASVYGSVSALQLTATVENTSGFQSAYKVLPPLRDEYDRRALIEGISNGSIDIICSNHRPLDKESKDLEFELSGFGSTGLVSAFGAARNATADHLPLEDLIRCFTTGPRQALSIPTPLIHEGEPANLTLFDPEIDWIFQKEHIRSKSENNALTGRKLKGRAVAVINNSQWELVKWN